MRGIDVPERTEDVTADPVELFFDLARPRLGVRCGIPAADEGPWTPLAGPGDDRAMTEPHESWNALGDRLESLALKLQLHYEQERDPPDPGAEGITASVERLGDSIEASFEAIVGAVDDDAVRDYATASARLLIVAIGATFTRLGDDLRSAAQPAADHPGDDADG